MNTRTEKTTLQPGKWYLHRGAYNNDKAVYVLDATGRNIQHMGFSGGGLTEPEPCFRGIDENGREYHDLTSASLSRQGIGHLTALDRTDTLTSEDIAALKAKAEQRREKQKQDAAAKAQAEENERQALPAQYPHLETVEGSKKSSHALAAANIRRELKKAFPGFKFSVRSSSFAGGDSVDISWTDGPTQKEVEAITNRYSEGTFNGMEDIYEYNRSTFTDVFGGAKYVMAQRSNTLEGIREAWIKAGNTDAEDITRGKYGYKYREQEFDQWTNPQSRFIMDTYRDTSLTPPAKPEPKTAAATGNTEAGPVTITEHTHTKKGFQMWIVELEEKVDKAAFMLLLDKAKACGGWYSRKWGETPGGFAFKTETQAHEFANNL